jgi:hypothetical protein
VPLLQMPFTLFWNAQFGYVDATRTRILSLLGGANLADFWCHGTDLLFGERKDNFWVSWMVITLIQFECSCLTTAFLAPWQLMAGEGLHPSNSTLFLYLLFTPSRFQTLACGHPPVQSSARLQRGPHSEEEKFCHSV